MKDNISIDWQSVGDWEDGRVKSSAKATIWVSLIFGIAFTGFGVLIVPQVPIELDQGNYGVLAALLFPLVGIAALVWFVRSVISWRKFGSAVLILDPVPGSIGGDFGGYVDIPIPWDSKATFNITLNCLKTRTTGSGKNRSTSTSVIWQREGVATLSPLSGKTRCAFRFAIPDDLPESEKSSSNYKHWQLQMQCDVPGVDFNRTYDVPVFKTEQPQFSTLKADYAKDSAPLEKAPEGIVKISNTAQGLQLYFPWDRSLVAGIMTLVFGSIFTGIAIFIPDDAGIIFPVVFGGVGSIVMLMGFYMMGNTLTTTISPRGINVIRNVYGIRFQRSIEVKDIKKLKQKITSHTNTASGNRVNYSINAHTIDGRKVTIADTLGGSRLADFVEKRIREALGEKPSSAPEDAELVIP